MARLFSFRLLLAGFAILSSSSCEKVHRVYFVPIGNAPLAEINLLIPHYRDRLGVVGRVLSPMKVTASDFDTARNQLIAENVIDSMIRAYPRYAADKSVVMIGITAQDMYARSMDGTASGGDPRVIPRSFQPLAWNGRIPPGRLIRLCCRRGCARW